MTKRRQSNAEKPPRLRRPSEQPWNDMNTKLELYISPDLKLRYGLPQRTTEEALKERSHDDQD